MTHTASSEKTADDTSSVHEDSKEEDMLATGSDGEIDSRLHLDDTPSDGEYRFSDYLSDEADLYSDDRSIPDNSEDDANEENLVDDGATLANILQDAHLEQIDEDQFNFAIGNLQEFNNMDVSMTSFSDDVATLESSFHDMSLDQPIDVPEGDEDRAPSKVIDSASHSLQAEHVHVPSLFGFTKYTAPPLLCRHPPPAVGRDDDITKLKEILDDILLKLGAHHPDFNSFDRIVIGPDNKIGSNMLKLMSTDEKYNIFLPELPLLHLRKSKITTLFAAYKDAGLLTLLQFMRDDDQEEWTKLITAEHIDAATRNVRRLAVAIELAFIVKFINSLEPKESELFQQDLLNGSSADISAAWDSKYQSFLKIGAARDSTFALHHEMLTHCNQVVAVHLSERLGGLDGYNLLLAALKQSLPFTFLNGASSYAPYCTLLLYEHGRSGVVHSNMKKHLYSTPWKHSTKNFAIDTRREMDHRDAHRAIRSGSSLEAVTCRMSLVDSLLQAHDRPKVGKDNEDAHDDLGWHLTDTDTKHILRTTALILRVGALSMQEGKQAYNMYLKQKTVLPQEILDVQSTDAGKYLARKFVTKNALFQCSEQDVPSADNVAGAPGLLARIKRSKGVTIRRTTKTKIPVKKTQREEKEEKRKTQVKKELRKVECLSSEMNTCQALVKPDCSKPKVQKATGISKALVNLLKMALSKKTEGNYEDEEIRQLINLNLKDVPHSIACQVKFVTVEFAGVKFRVYPKTGSEYLLMVQNGVLKPILHQFPKLQRMVICEEKYQFTPDTFKAATRDQRKTRKKDSISHLKEGTSMISSKKFDKNALITTPEGKNIISLYLAQNIEKLSINSTVTIDVDSELHIGGCVCENDQSSCQCDIHTVPITCNFLRGSNASPPIIHSLDDIQQRKGEAEMAQADWLLYYLPHLQQGDAIASIVTSGDIDAVTIHLFLVSRLWPRNESGAFRSRVYVILQKPGKKVDVYNITSILETLEEVYKDNKVGMKLAISLCMGGNDFIPKYHQVTHDKVVKEIFARNHFLENIISFQDSKMNINADVYIDLIKSLYCPKSLANRSDPLEIPFDTVRQATIQMRHSSQQVRHPQQWMPPESALRRVVQLVDFQLQYLLIAGDSGADLPDFLSKECLKRTDDGEIEYDFGPEAHMTLSFPSNKRQNQSTPQKGQRKKRQLTSTPKKSQKK